MPQAYDKPEQPKTKIIAKKKTNSTNSRKTNFATPQIVAQPKTILKIPLKEKSIFQERSVKYIDQIVKVPKSIVTKKYWNMYRKLLIKIIQLLGQKHKMRCRIPEEKTSLC